MKNKKPFDLEAALRGELLITRSGDEAKIIAQLNTDDEYKLIVKIKDRETRNESVESCTIDGKRYVNDGGRGDLFMAPTSRKLYGCYFESDSILEYPCSNLFTTEELREDYISRMKEVINKEVHKFEVEME